MRTQAPQHARRTPIQQVVHAARDMTRPFAVLLALASCAALAVGFLLAGVLL